MTFDATQVAHVLGPTIRLRPAAAEDPSAPPLLRDPDRLLQENAAVGIEPLPSS